MLVLALTLAQTLVLVLALLLLLHLGRQNSNSDAVGYTGVVLGKQMIWANAERSPAPGLADHRQTSLVDT